MKHTELKIYDTNAHVYEYTQEDIDSGVISVVLEVKEDEIQWTPILKDGNFILQDKRWTTAYYGLGYTTEGIVSVVVEDVDQKQLANILLSHGVKEAALTDARVVRVTLSPILAEKITADDITDTWLGGPDMTITAGTIKISDIVEEPKPKKRKRK